MNMIYAPVLIPTLNRMEHLSQCIESLEKCTGAECTDIFVALDYPPNDKYVSGWKRTDQWLAEKEKIHNFKSFTVIRRNENYHLKGGNLKALATEVFLTYDRVIISEDDNIFSPCFLQYVNKGLQRFEHDETVLAINGYLHMYPIKHGEATFIRQNVDFSAWGYGIWRDRRIRYQEVINRDFFRENMSLSNLIKMRTNGNNRAIDFMNYASAKTQKIPQTDNALSVYMALEGLDVVMPAASLVRNIGWDGSGLHCSSTDKMLADAHMNQSYSQDTSFEFVGTGKEFYDENRQIYSANSYARKTNLQFFKAFAKYLIKRLVYR